MDAKKITTAPVRADFNDPLAVVHYARAAHFLGLWESERSLLEKYFPGKSLPLLEAGCGAGRVAVALWQLGYSDLTAFDFAEELIDQARFLAEERGATAIRPEKVPRARTTGSPPRGPARPGRASARTQR